VGEGPGEENAQVLKQLATAGGGEYVVVAAPPRGKGQAPRRAK
jgi:hypothetical protein